MSRATGPEPVERAPGRDGTSDDGTPDDGAAGASTPVMTAGMRAVWVVCWVGSAVGLGLGSARLVGVSAALLGPRGFEGLLADAAFSGVLGSALFGFGLVACYWVVSRERRGFGALSLYLAAVAVAGLGTLDPPAGYLAVAVPLVGLAELAYNRRRGYFDAPAVTPAERVQAALDGGESDGDDPGRHPRSADGTGRSRRRL